MSRVIRGAHASRSIVPREVRDAREQAEDILRQAHDQAERLVEQARDEADDIRRRAVSEGREQGRAETVQHALRAAGRRDRELADAEAYVVRIALAAARRLVDEELSLEPARIRSIARNVLERARRAHAVTLRVHPDDVDALQDLVASRGPGVVVEADPTLQRGDCLALTDLGELDARIETQLEALERALLDEYR